MKKQGYALLVVVTVVMGLLAVIASQALDVSLRDPDGSLGPAWLRMPLMVAGAFVVDVVSRGLWRCRGKLAEFPTVARAIVREHWTRDRIILVAVGLVTFYITYVSYRNLKNYLPFMGSFNNTRDQLLHSIDRTIAFGHEPAVLLHQLLGESFSAHILAFVYLFFLPFSPFALVAWLVWSRNISFGAWFATAFCLAWALGTASYYALPTLGPNFAYVWLYADLDQTGVTSLQEALYNGRMDVWWDPLSSSIQSVAGFASLHVAITLLAALMAHYTVRQTWIRWGMWVYVGLTVVSTLYFGWHYIADDVAGAIIAFVCVWLGGLATGQDFDKNRRSAPEDSRAGSPATTTDAPADPVSAAKR